MKGFEFEKLICGLLSKNGYWAYNFAKAKNGSQPFDIIAIKGKEVCAYDCKVISTKAKSLSKDRVEFNQESAFKRLSELGDLKECGFLVFKNDKIYFLPFGDKDLTLTEQKLWMYQFQTKFI